MLQFRDSDVFEEYKTPVGGSVDIICSQTYQKITVDEVDSDPTDMKLTVMCLPTMKYDIPRENFPKVIKKYKYIRSTMDHHMSMVTRLPVCLKCF